MSKKHLQAKIRAIQDLRVAIIVLAFAIFGTYLLLGSRAASPYGDVPNGSGALGNGATSQNCIGASTNSCVNFSSPLPMDGGVALALNGLGAPFSPTSFWNTPLPADDSGIAANPNNTVYNNEILTEVCNGSYSTSFSSCPASVPAVNGACPNGRQQPVNGNCPEPNSASLNSGGWSSPIYVVPANQPKVPVITYCGFGDTDQNMTDSNWSTAGWSANTTSATHTAGNTSPLVNNQSDLGPGGSYQVSFTFSGNPASGSTVTVSAGKSVSGSTQTPYVIGTYTFTPGQDNFTITNEVVTVPNGDYFTPLTFTPSSDFDGTISAVTVLPYKPGLGPVVASGVPIPADAHGSGETQTPQVDTDRVITIYQPSADNGQGAEWEFWQFQKDPNLNTWEACWGGVIDNVSQSDGIFPNNTGASATSLPVLGGIPRIEEFQAGQINHVIGLVLPYSFYSTGSGATKTFPANVNDPGSKAYSWPATRNDGSSPDTLAVPEGQRFRLDPTLDLSQYDPSNPNAATPLSPMAYVIAVAAQKYGFVVDDKGGTVAFRIGDPTTYIAAGLPNPYTTGAGVGGVNDGNKGLLDGKSFGQTMAGFPWNRLVALPFNYGDPQ